MSFIENIKIRAKSKKMKIVLPESMDKRVMEAAAIASNEGIADIIIIGKDEVLKESAKGFDISKATIIDPDTSEITEERIKV